MTALEWKTVLEDSGDEGEEEELFADYSGKMQAPWERRGGFTFGLFIIVAIGMIAMGIVSGNSKGFSKGGSSLPTFTSQHSHYV